MSQFAPQPVIPVPVRETNGLGLAGFICSLVGLFAGGLLCPIGLVLSLIALGRRPRGFAVAGVVIGLIGSCGIVLVFLFAGAAILAALGLAVVAVALSDTEKLEITGDMVNMAVAIKTYEKENSYLPASLTDLALKSTALMDPWGNPYEYHLLDERPGFDIVSSGLDGQFGTTDDVRFTALGEAWKAGGVGFQIEEVDDGSTVRIKVGDRTITATGRGDGGEVTIDLGDRVIEIVGDEEGEVVEVQEVEGEEEVAEMEEEIEEDG